MTRRLRAGRLALWIIPVIGAAAGMALAVMALQTDDLTLAANPCAGSFDNQFMRLSQLAFLAGLCGSVAIFVLAAVRKDRTTMVLGIAAIVSGVTLMVVGLLLASAGYGWRCPA